MYWCDAHTEEIWSADINGKNNITVYKADSKADPFDIAVHGGYIYWTDWALKGIFRFVGIARGFVWPSGGDYTGLCVALWWGLHGALYGPSVGLSVVIARGIVCPSVEIAQGIVCPSVEITRGIVCHLIDTSNGGGVRNSSRASTFSETLSKVVL